MKRFVEGIDRRQSTMFPQAFSHGLGHYTKSRHRLETSTSGAKAAIKNS